MSVVRPFMLSSCAAATLTAAAEPAVADLRVGTEAWPAAFSYAWDDGSQARSGDDAFDGSWAIAVGVRQGFGPAASPHRLLLGVDLVGCDDRMPGAVHQATLGRATVGYGYGVNPQWMACAGLTAAWGPSRWQASGSVPDLTGSQSDVAGEVGVRWQPSERWSLGLSAGWLQGDERLEGDGATMTVRRSGLFWGLQLGWTWDVRPRALE